MDEFQWQHVEDKPCKVEYATLKAYGLTMPVIKSELTVQDRVENHMTALAMWAVLSIVFDQLTMGEGEHEQSLR